MKVRGDDTLEGAHSFAQFLGQISPISRHFLETLTETGSILGWPHPNSESDKKIRARYFLPLYDPYKWIPKGILILTTRRPLPRLKFFWFFAPHVGLQTSTAYCSQFNCHEFWKAFSDFQWNICNISELSMDPMRTRLPVEAWEQYRVFNIHIVRSMKQFIYFMIKGLPNSRIPRPVHITLKQSTDF